ncbi:MAG: adenosylcobinamide-GDP ribazoletransferase, partial [Micromonosporaceae bacterium]
AGLGALVAGTTTWRAWAPPAVITTGAAALATPDRLWQGPVAVLLALAVSQLLLRHAIRRFGGVTGDVLGAVTEISVTVALIVLALG